MSVSQQCSFRHRCFCLDEDDRLKIMSDYFDENEAKRLAASKSSRKKNRTKEEYLRMMLFMAQAENLHLMIAALGTHESREISDKEAMYGRYDPHTGYVLHSYLFAMFA
jgi:hypothetical protein